MYKFLTIDRLAPVQKTPVQKTPVKSKIEEKCDVCKQNFSCEELEDHVYTHFAPSIPKRYHGNITFRTKKKLNFN